MGQRPRLDGLPFRVPRVSRCRVYARTDCEDGHLIGGGVVGLDRRGGSCSRGEEGFGHLGRRVEIRNLEVGVYGRHGPLLIVHSYDYSFVGCHLVYV